MIENDNINNVKNELDKCFGGVVNEDAIERIPNFSNTCSWWDLDTQKIELSYNKFMSGKKRIFRDTLKSREVWVFIARMIVVNTIYIFHTNYV
ncbi:hypothetical protein M972_11922 [Acetivibrio thermocellus AD2]|uniref:Uncharacterized protein n=1 Tax=Acetivibrio thermocellus AD2 TaxID=1138384 RepID=A0AB36TF49_ACETH|nr:hypothetical protein Clo1313_0879 [Acetivibrio thermocellus DSM 1313]ALX07885.1 hypothetical protein AD2_00890 [Acetivibrio thermocellus AD2]ANV75631.1 hypothetical protein LQRI_0890 [Acetivibrio thermocellus DSM 2360]EIC03252.1 hypothetical protein YSBL_0209 [Acetivibrio thermocellus YS]SOD26371.1 hypothetical protein SAMN04515622_2666 [Acetivibrio thermocellus]